MLEKVLDVLWQKNQEGIYVTPFLWGGTGQGKTQRTKAWAKAKALDCIVLHFATQETGDLIGMPDIQSGEYNGEAFLKTVWAAPEWLANAWPGTVFFLDELNRAAPSVINAVFSLFFDRKLHTHKLPKESFIIAAGNPDTEDYQVTTFIDRAFLDRFVHLNYSVRPSEWLNYVEGRVDPAILQLVRANPEKALRNKPIDLGFTRHPSPRSLELLGLICREMESAAFEEIGLHIARGLIGDELAVAYAQARKNGLRRLGAKEVIEYFIERENDLRALLDEKRFDVINEINTEIFDHLAYFGRLKKAAAQNLLDYILLLPIDLASGLLHKLFHEMPWIKKAFVEADEKKLCRLVEKVEAAQTQLRKNHDRKKTGLPAGRLS